ncbi:amidohydrolase family protein [Hymenobacter radiodurans]|uniref:amidohydrolase family protein n=1 Tax=Hymenobacter radiodurans TaxID=2496028 RepID=UPI0010591DDF
MSDYSPAQEYKLLAQAGLSFAQILAALTTNPAQRFGLSQQTGTIAVGKQADLVLLTADPAVNIEHLT